MVADAIVPGSDGNYGWQQLHEIESLAADVVEFVASGLVADKYAAATAVNEIIGRVNPALLAEGTWVSDRLGSLRTTIEAFIGRPPSLDKWGAPELLLLMPGHSQPLALLRLRNRMGLPVTHTRRNWLRQWRWDAGGRASQFDAAQALSVTRVGRRALQDLLGQDQVPQTPQDIELPARLRESLLREIRARIRTGTWTSTSPDAQLVRNLWLAMTAEH